MEILIRYDQLCIVLTGFDHALAKSFADVIQKNLGRKTIQKVEDRLFEKFGISFTQSIEQFDKLDLVLRELFGKGTDGLERKFLDSLCIIKSKKSGEKWFTIHDSSISDIILRAFGDADKKKILETTNSIPKIVYDILEDSKLPQTSGYRKVNALIDDGLLIQSGFVKTKDNKSVSKYICVFNNLRINFDSNKITVDIQLNDNQVKQSSILRTITM